MGDEVCAGYGATRSRDVMFHDLEVSFLIRSGQIAEGHAVHSDVHRVRYADVLDSMCDFPSGVPVRGLVVLNS